MSRSAADATRFTATGPYASSKPGAAPYKLPGFMADSKKSTAAGAGGKPETPKEKVERLRAQARAARMAQSTSHMDRLVDVGRRFANKAHKVMVYTLITASGICGALTVYSMVSLTLYNRRQRTLWVEKELQKLQDAKAAYASGSATPEQIEMVRNEEIGEIFKQKKAEEKAQRPWNKAKAYLFGGLKTEETPSDLPAKANGAADNKIGVLEALNAKALEDSKPSGSVPVPASPQPGQLDVLAENVETAAKETTRSWKSWLTGR